MPEDAFDEVYQNGVVISSTQRVISDAEIRRRSARLRLRQALPTLDQWQADFVQWATDAEAVSAAGGTPNATQLRALFHRFAQTSDRLSTLSDRLHDLIEHLVEQ